MTPARTRFAVAAVVGWIHLSSTVPTRAAASATPAPIVVPTYEIRVDPSDLRKLDRNPATDDTVPAVFLAGGVTYDPVRLRYRGEWARGWPKKPLKVFFDREHRYDGHRSLNLNSAWRDPAFVREALAYHVYEVCGVPAPRARVVHLNLNAAFRGLYIEVEQPDRTLLRRHHLDGAVLFKATSRGEGADERAYANLATCAQNYTNETHPEAGVQEVHQFGLDLARATNVLEFFERRVDVVRLINYLAATALVQHWDWPTKNHLLVRDARGSGKWFVMPWDLDRTFGDHWNQRFDVADLPLELGTRRNPSVIGWNRLQDKLLREPTLRARFRTRLQELLTTEFTPDRLFPLLDQYEALLKADAQRDRRLWPGPAGDFHAGIVGVKDFINRRRAFLLAELARP